MRIYQKSNENRKSCFVILGTAIIINSQVVHKSEKNTSGRSREIYTFHIAESKNTEWSSQNW